MSAAVDHYPVRHCNGGPNAVERCGKVATVVCSDLQDDGLSDSPLQWFACDDESHHAGSVTEPIEDWFRSVHDPSSQLFFRRDHDERWSVIRGQRPIASVTCFEAALAAMKLLSGHCARSMPYKATTKLPPPPEPPEGEPR